MNKLIIDELEVNLENINANLEIKNKNVLIHLKGQNNINSLHFPNEGKITIKMNEFSTLHFNSFETIQDFEGKIILECSHQNKIYWNQSIKVLGNFKLILETNINGNNNEAYIKVRIITENFGRVALNSLGYIKKDTKDNIFIEDLKGLNLNGDSLCFLPDLKVESDAVSAVHNATISNIREEDIFYLKTKGLSENSCKEILKQGFLNNILERNGGEKNE